MPTGFYPRPVRRAVFTCQRCGVTFDRALADVRKGSGRFCSRACFATPIAERLAAHSVPAENGCIVYTRSVNANGYGRMGIVGSRRQMLAHRVAWELANGPIPDGLFVCHKCDNPPCVNVEHLFLGASVDNVRDMIAKGRDVASVRPDRVRLGHPLQEFCKRGHRMADTRGRNGHCRECVRAYNREYRQAHTR